MTYIDVIENGYQNILPKKTKYTKRDADKIYIHGFINGFSWSDKTCKFIVVCTAIFNNATYSKYFYN